VLIWQPNPQGTEIWQCDELITDKGEHIARIEDFGFACFPTACNAASSNWERGGAFLNRTQAILWAERVADAANLPAK
jgi:hypothetical protein